MYQLIYNTESKLYSIQNKKKGLSKKCKQIARIKNFDNASSICQVLNNGSPQVKLKRLNNGIFKHKVTPNKEIMNKGIVSNEVPITLSDLNNMPIIFANSVEIHDSTTESIKNIHLYEETIIETNINPSEPLINVLNVEGTVSMKTLISSSNLNDSLETNENSAKAYNSTKKLVKNIDLVDENVIKSKINQSDLTITNAKSISTDVNSPVSSTSVESTPAVKITTEPLNFETSSGTSKIDINDSNMKNKLNAIDNLSEEKNNFDKIFDYECDNIIETHVSQVILTKEDELIEFAIIPTESDDIQKLYSEESDMVTCEANYEISDQLENILCSQLEGRAIEIVREDSQIFEEPDLSPLRIAQEPKQLIPNDTASSSLIWNSRNYEDSNDTDFNPNEIKHSSTTLDESVSEKSYDDSSINNVSNTEKNNSNCTSTNKSEEVENEIPEKLEEKKKNKKPERCKDYLPETNEKNEVEIENLEDKVPKVSSTSNYVNSESELRKIPLSRVGSCDNTNLSVPPNTIPRWRKKYHCMYCHKNVVKLPRHLETVHKVFEDVKKLKDIEKGTLERKQILKDFRNHGNFMFNTNTNYNEENELKAPRRSKVVRPATDFTTCPNCLLTITIGNSRKHISKCGDVKIKGSRTYKVLGNVIEGRLHKSASEKLRLVIFPVLKEDAIVRLIRYDWLIILYGNKLCLKYGPHYQHNMIRARLRLLGRFLRAAKDINSEVTDLSSLYVPKYVDTVIDAIAVVARIDRLTNSCGAPAVAENLVTYIKQIGTILEAEYVKTGNEEGLKHVINFLKVYKTETPDSINKIAMECQAKVKRQKVVILPMTEDIQKLISYLRVERKKCFAVLSKRFVLSEWLNGLKLVAVYLLVFNRRRVGDIQNILVSDLDKLENIDKGSDKEEFNLLDDNGKKIAGNYYRFQIRGKLNRIVAVIASADLITELKILISFRQQAQIPVNNEFLFGLPNPVTDRIRVLNLCKEMRVISNLCGAQKPDLLRGTGLRKHVATKCIELDLKDSALSDVITHLGHSEKIHKEIYRQPLKSKTIVQVTKVLEAAQGKIDDLDSDDEGDERSDFLELPTNDSLDHSNQTNNQSSVLDSVPPRSMTDADTFKQKENCSSLLYPQPSTSTACEDYFVQPDNNISPNKSTTNYARNRLWSEKEKNIITSEFKNYLESGKLPSFKVIDDLKARHPCFKDRPRASIKTWVSNQFKSRSTPMSRKPKVTSNVKASFNMSKFQRMTYDDDSS